MDEPDWLISQFEGCRAHLRAVAYRMLGSLSDADDAVQETWLRLSRSDISTVKNLSGWLTTIVARICLNILRSRREEPVDPHVPDPIVTREDGADPEQQVLMADSVGLALQVVLETLAPAERLAFVLHDMFSVPFEDIAPLVGRSPDTTRKLASRARRRVQGGAAVPDADLDRQRAVVDAFFAAVRAGDFDALIAVLDPDVVGRADGGAGRPTLSAVLRGANAVAGQALTFARPAALVRPALVNGAAGAVVIVGGRLAAVMGFTVTNGKIVEIDTLVDPERLSQLNPNVFDVREKG